MEKKYRIVNGKRVISLMVIVLGMTMVSGCNQEVKEEVKSIEKVGTESSKGDVNKIFGKMYSDSDIENLVSTSSGDDYTDKNTNILKEVLINLGVEESKEYKKGYKEAIKGKTLTESDEETVRTTLLYQYGLEKVYGKIIKIADKEIGEELRGKPLNKGVLQVIVDSQAIKEDEGVVKEIKGYVKGLKSEKDLLKFINDYSKEDQEGLKYGGKINVSIEEFNKYNVDENGKMGRVLKKEVGDTYIIGEGEYQGVFRILTSKELNKSEIESKLRTQEVAKKYTDVGKLLLDMEKSYKGLKYSNYVRESIKNGWK